MRKSQKQLDETSRQLGCNIRYMIQEKGTKAERCAAACGMSPTTWSRRMNHPGEFTFGEINLLANLWGVSPARVMYGRLTEGEDRGR